MGLKKFMLKFRIPLQKEPLEPLEDRMQNSFNRSKVINTLENMQNVVNNMLMLSEMPDRHTLYKLRDELRARIDDLKRPRP